LDPLQFLQAIRSAQAQRTLLAERNMDANNALASDLGEFLAGLATAWQRGESRPPHRRKPRGPRLYRTRPDPFAAVWPLVLTWLEAQPHPSGNDGFVRLQAEFPGQFDDRQMRTLQRRVSAWRTERARHLIMTGVQPERSLRVTERVP
jgi:hypothetical protein